MNAQKIIHKFLIISSLFVIFDIILF